VNGSFIALSISDTGTGIQEGILEKIFEPFFTTKQVGKGSGMGLSVVHGIVHDHNGHILVDTRVDEGTTFKALFPSVERKSTTRERITTLQREPHEAGPGRHVLVVDDEEAIAVLLRDILESWGYEVDAFTESPKALEWFKENPRIYALVITDQTMPKLTGIELAREVGKLNEELPVLLCTGYSELVNEESAKTPNIRGFLSKPVEIQKLSRLVKELAG
jgi:CheY-like chemotaxis protein